VGRCVLRCGLERKEPRHSLIIDTIVIHWQTTFETRFLPLSLCLSYNLSLILSCGCPSHFLSFLISSLSTISLIPLSGDGTTIVLFLSSLSLSHPDLLYWNNQISLNTHTNKHARGKTYEIARSGRRRYLRTLLILFLPRLSSCCFYCCSCCRRSTHKHMPPTRQARKRTFSCLIAARPSCNFGYTAEGT